MLAKNASKVTCRRCSGAISSSAIGTMIASNLARIAFLSCSRRVPLRELHLLVVRQVDRDGLRARVAVAGVVDDVVGVEVGVGARASRPCRRPAPAGRAAARAASPRTREALAPLQVLDQHVGLERGLVAEQLVLVGLDRPDHEVERGCPSCPARPCRSAGSRRCAAPWRAARGSCAGPGPRRGRRPARAARPRGRAARRSASSTARPRARPSRRAAAPCTRCGCPAGWRARTPPCVMSSG